MRPDAVCISRTTSGMCANGLVRRPDDDRDAVVELAQLAVGDDAGHLDEGVGAQVETGHLAVDPDDAVEACGGSCGSELAMAPTL